ncbi:MAG: Asp-tRNA(Asn)/Glu-tRNA(Gln) amidotransferase subunit GatB [archaeon]|nr:Asp-tRNA(Asn)/Glu-tRNA(Gln) amidotransferase subunit GatB [archaeon]
MNQKIEQKSKVRIGLECHVQLATKSKLFCACPTKGEDIPNSRTCPTCLGLPGSKPVLNKTAVDFALTVALALNCKLNREFFFSRKTYFYPDLAKNYQITQYEVPVGEKGFLEIAGKKIGITRVHLEEDPASLVHEDGAKSSNYSLVDYNRSGIPLVEIVTEPDMSSPKEAREFMDSLLNILNYLGIYEHGVSVLKADCNLSYAGGNRVEVKNVTGFRAIEQALLFEEQRQKAQASKAGVLRETRGFDAQTGVTYSMRKKETENDYGFIADADLPVVKVDDLWVKKIKSKLPELPEQKALRIAKEFGLTEYDAKVIAQSKRLSDIFEAAGKIDSKIAVRIVSRELLGVLNYNKLSLEDTKVDANGISGLVMLLKGGKVGDKNAKESLIKYVLEGILPEKFLEENKLLIDSSEIDVKGVVAQVVSENAQAFSEFRSGNQKSLNFLIGQCMRRLKGRADARQLQKELEAMK